MIKYTPSKLMGQRTTDKLQIKTKHLKFLSLLKEKSVAKRESRQETLVTMSAVYKIVNTMAFDQVVQTKLIHRYLIDTFSPKCMHG